MPAIEVGLQDAWHPVGLATLLVFASFLVRYVHTKSTYFLVGITFFGTAQFFRRLLVVGSLDGYVTVDGVFTGIRIFYLVLGVLFFGVGCYQWRQWWRIRFQHIAHVPREIPITASKLKTFAITLLLMIVSFFLSAGFVITSSIVTQDYSVFIMIMDAKSRGEAGKEAQLMMQYVLASNLVLFVAWLILSSRLFERTAKIWRDRQPTFLIVSSAFFMSVSIGLIWQFLK